MILIKQDYFFKADEIEYVNFAMQQNNIFVDAKTIGYTKTNGYFNCFNKSIFYSENIVDINNLIFSKRNNKLSLTFLEYRICLSDSISNTS